MSARVSDQDIAELQQIIGPWTAGQRTHFDTVRDALLDLQELRQFVRDLFVEHHDGKLCALCSKDLRALLPED